MDAAEFDMFAGRQPFTMRVARIMARHAVAGPVGVYTTLVVGVCVESMILAAAIAEHEGIDDRAAMAGLLGDALKFAIMSLETATEEELEDKVTSVLDAAGEDAERLAEDPASVVEAALGSGSEGESESKSESEEDLSPEDLSPEVLRRAVDDRAAAWDGWLPEDPLLSGMKSSFAEAHRMALARFEDAF